MKNGTKKVKILWISANIFGYEVLKEAMKIDEVDVIGVVTLSVKATTKMYDGIDRKKWHEFDIPVYEIENINDEKRLIESLNPDFIFMAGWRQIVSRDILDIPLKGFIGFHPSLLPKNRGPAPIINTILMGLKKSGVTMFYASVGLDDGDIIGQSEYDIKENDCAQDIYKKAIFAGRALVKNFLPKLINGNAPRIKQKEKDATFFEKRTLKDNEIDLSIATAEDVLIKIRAFSKPFNGAYIKINGKKIIIWRAQIEDEKK